MRYLLLILIAAFNAFCSDSLSRSDLLGPVKVSKISSLDERKGVYKSPRRAMFMSLVLPGSGQLYVRSSASNVYRGAFYLAEEAALITGFYYQSVYKYDKQVKKYRGFAKENFSVIRYEKAMDDLYLTTEYGAVFNNVYGSNREEYCKSIYGTLGDRNASCYEFGKGLAFANTNYEKNKNSMKNPADFYRIISDDSFILGWNDVEQNVDNVSYLNPENNRYMTLGTSDKYEAYKDMRKKAKKYADRQVLFLGALIVNHIVSAVDAALSAQAHNNRLYEENISLLDRVNLAGTLEPVDFRVGLLAWLSI